MFSSQLASHLSITLSVPADKHLPTDERRETGKEERKALVQQLWIIDMGHEGDITR